MQSAQKGTPHPVIHHHHTDHKGKEDQAASITSEQVPRGGGKGAGSKRTFTPKKKQPGKGEKFHQHSLEVVLGGVPRAGIPGPAHPPKEKYSQSGSVHPPKVKYSKSVNNNHNNSPNLQKYFTYRTSTPSQREIFSPK